MMACFCVSAGVCTFVCILLCFIYTCVCRRTEDVKGKSVWRTIGTVWPSDYACAVHNYPVCPLCGGGEMPFLLCLGIF